MKRFGLLFIIISALGLSGCDRVTGPDYTPPSPPTGLYTATGDNFIELFWQANLENDVAGYNVFSSATYDGPYQLIGSTHTPYFNDTGARNGSTYYYAVTAYDFDGNESDLSKDVAYDVPRPEGYDVVLNNYHQSPAYAGYDFSNYRVQAYNDLYSDMYFEYYSGEYYMNVRSDTRIQDVGPTNSLLDVHVSPTSGWSATNDAVLRVGHTYVVFTWDFHYAKFRVTSLSSNRVVFDWAYQMQELNPMLKPVGRGGGVRQLAEVGAEH